MTVAGGRSPEVDEWFERYDNPMKSLAQQVREAILDADPRVGETIKWQAPTFVYRGNIASFFPKSRAHVTLMFHTGASLDDPDGLLQGDGAVARAARFVDDAELARTRGALQAIVRSWVADRAP